MKEGGKKAVFVLVLALISNVMLIKINERIACPILYHLNKEKGSKTIDAHLLIEGKGKLIIPVFPQL